MTDEYIERLRRRFEAKVDRSGGPDACWPWTGMKDKDGYGRIKIAGKGKLAHRVAWFLSTGKMPPPSIFILHSPIVCHNPSCCNLKHLREGTHSDNMFDAVMDGTQIHTRKTHCPHGHPYDDENTRIEAGGSRKCRACSKAYYEANADRLRARWRAWRAANLEYDRQRSRERGKAPRNAAAVTS